VDEREQAWAELLEARPTGWFVGGRRLPVLLLALATLLVAGCDFLEPDRPQLPPGTRALIIPVENRSNVPAVLVVAEDRQPVGRAVGSAQPAAVPAGARIDVTFIVPNAPGWAIFVNPGPERGPLLLHTDLRNCTGRVPAFIEVRPGGEAQWGHGPDRGCLTP